jgi:hypothetical protein
MDNLRYGTSSSSAVLIRDYLETASFSVGHRVGEWLDLPGAHEGRPALPSDFLPEADLASGPAHEQQVYVTAAESALLKRALLSSVRIIE